MDWLIDLIVSNLWLLIILYGVFSSFSKAGKQKRETTKPINKPELSRPKQSPVWKADDDWSRSVPTFSDWSPSTTSKEPESPPPKEPDRQESGKEEADVWEETKRAADPVRLTGPAQGMIWSQVFGPPRSKQPHRIYKK